MRRQIVVLQRSSKRPRLKMGDRVFWVLLSRIWSGWRESLSFVKPETVIRWHRRGFRLYWTWKSRRTGQGRPTVSPEVRELIHKMSRANPLWGAPRLHGELEKLGIEISQAAVSKYLVRQVSRRPLARVATQFTGGRCDPARRVRSSRETKMPKDTEAVGRYCSVSTESKGPRTSPQAGDPSRPTTTLRAMPGRRFSTECWPTDWRRSSL